MSPEIMRATGALASLTDSHHQSLIPHCQLASLNYCATHTYCHPFPTNAANIFKYIFLSRSFCILIQIQRNKQNVWEVSLIHNIILHVTVYYSNIGYWSKRLQTETSTTKMSTDPNVDKPKRRQTETSTDQTVDKTADAPATTSHRRFQDWSTFFHFHFNHA